jgi:branched-chain amino acid transport system substrate-binding protein
MVKDGLGKSSVLQQIRNLVQLDGFVFIEFDLQHKGQLSLSNILHDLAKQLLSKLSTDGNNLQPPTEAELELDINLFSRFLLEMSISK